MMSKSEINLLKIKKCYDRRSRSLMLRREVCLCPPPPLTTELESSLKLDIQRVSNKNCNNFFIMMRNCEMFK